MFTPPLQMTDPPPEACSELHTAGLFVVSSLRLWARAYCARDGGGPDWQEGFLRAGLGSEAITGFDTVWRLVASTAYRCLDIRPLFCARVGADETRFLHLLGRLQRDRPLDAKFILHGWCPPSAVRLAMAPAQTVAFALREHCLWLPPGDAQAAMGSSTFRAPPLESARTH